MDIYDLILGSSDFSSVFDLGYLGGILSGLFTGAVLLVLLPTLLIALILYAPTYILNSYNKMYIGRKAGLKKDWMAFVPIASSIYQLESIGEEWWKVFFFDGFLVFAITSIITAFLSVISGGLLAVVGAIISIVAYLACFIYGIYYLVKFYRMCGIKTITVLVLFTPFSVIIPRILYFLVGFTDVFEFNGKEPSGKKSASRASAPPVGGKAVSQSTDAGLTGLNGMYANQMFNIADNDEVIIGRDPAYAHIVLDVNADKVSRKHCAIVFNRAQNCYYVTDCSTNGTFIDGGNRLLANVPTSIARGTVIAIGSKENRFRLN